MFKIIISTLSIAIFLSSCAAHMGPNNSFLGGYTDRKIDEYIYLIEYEGFMFTDSNSLEKGIHARATELCNTSDYELDIKSGGQFKKSIIYCNSSFIDTRLQASENKFHEYKRMEADTFEYNELTPIYHLLITDQHDKLNQYLEKIVNEYQADNNKEIGLASILNTFGRPSENFKTKIDNWIKHTPDSPIALYARAQHYHTKAWKIRGNGYWDSLLAGQKIKFKKHIELAKEDIKKAIKINPKLSILHAFNIQIDNTQVTAKDSYEAALKYTPYSFIVKSAFVRHLLPRWGGSMKALTDYTEKNKALSNKNPQLTKLSAYTLIEEGDSYLFKEKYKEALAKYNEAIKIADLSFAYHQRGFALTKLTRYLEAIDSYKHAIQISPYKSRSYENLLSLFIKNGNIVDALKASSFLIAMDNNNEALYLLRGNLFYSIRRYKDALSNYTKARNLTPESFLYSHKIKLTEYQINVRKGDMIAPSPSTSI